MSCFLGLKPHFTLKVWDVLAGLSLRSFRVTGFGFDAVGTFLLSASALAAVCGAAWAGVTSTGSWCETLGGSGMLAVTAPVSGFPTSTLCSTRRTSMLDASLRNRVASKQLRPKPACAGVHASSPLTHTKSLGGSHVAGGRAGGLLAKYLDTNITANTSAATVETSAAGERELTRKQLTRRIFANIFVRKYLNFGLWQPCTGFLRAVSRQPLQLPALHLLLCVVACQAAWLL